MKEGPEVAVIHERVDLGHVVKLFKWFHMLFTTAVLIAAEHDDLKNKSRVGQVRDAYYGHEIFGRLHKLMKNGNFTYDHMVEFVEFAMENKLLGKKFGKDFIK